MFLEINNNKQWQLYLKFTPVVNNQLLYNKNKYREYCIKDIQRNIMR